MRKLKGKKKGSGILEFIVVIAVVAVLAAVIIPKFNKAVENRNINAIDYFNGTDTITEID